MSVIRKMATYLLLVSVYAFTLLAAVAGNAVPRRRWKPNGRIMVTGTFFNPNWYLSHVTPLARSGVKEVILVIDEPQLPLAGVRFACPPKWLAKLISRAGAKALWMLVAGLRYRPDLYMGYHIAPGACSALVAGKLLGRPACYQMTVGPLEVIGGGIGATESVAGTLGRPSRLLETLAFAILNRFDLVVVRGNQAKTCLETYHTRGTIAIITGSIQRSAAPPQTQRTIDLVFVGRLVPVKQVDQFLAIVKAVSVPVPSVQAAVVGDGPLLEEMKARSEQLGLAGNVDFLGKRKDVPAILANAKVFLLTSQYEGLSIALAEAMATGVVPVVAQVGELSDLVEDGVNGYLLEPNDIDKYAEKVTLLLQNHALRADFSARAKEAAIHLCDVESVSERWRQSLEAAITQASGCCPEADRQPLEVGLAQRRTHA